MKTPDENFDHRDFISRELSWIDFNSRVLDEAAFNANKLLEKLKFISIVSGNLDEFFMVRIAGLRQMVKSGANLPDPAGNRPDRQLKLAKVKITRMLHRQYNLLMGNILPELAGYGVVIRNMQDLSEDAVKRLHRYFTNQILPVLTPLAVDPAHPFPLLNSGAIEIALELKRNGRKGNVRAFVEVPELLERFVPLARVSEFDDGEGVPFADKSDDNAPKVDYSGANPTTGLWISETTKYLYPDTQLSDSSNYTTIPKGTVFEVTKIISSTCFAAKCNGKTGYVSVNSSSPIYQLTSTAAAGTSTDKVETDKVETDKVETDKVQTDKVETEATVTPNKYSVTDEIKTVKGHVGSGIDKYFIDEKNVEPAKTYTLNAGQTMGISGFAGFESYIKEFGYYFDGNAENVVWGATPGEPDANVKKKAGNKAKLFDIKADTSGLSAGEHTVTYMVKFLNNKTCELITLNLNVGGASVQDGSESGSESTGEGDGGCKSAVAMSFALPIVLVAGAAIIKKKKED